MARSLLVAVDDTDASERAFAWVLQHLYREGDEVHLVHVIPRLQMAATYGVPPVDFVPLQDGNYEAVIRSAEHFITERFVKNIPSGASLSPIVHIVKSEVDTESVGHVICRKADELDVVCVALASQNKGRVAEFFLGSVTQFCTHHSQRPVVVVH